MKKTLIIVSCIIVSLLGITPLEAQRNNMSPAFSEVNTSDTHSHNSNPWGLVYAGALTENVTGKVNIHPITYTLNGLKIAANVYTPAGYDPAKSYPALVVAHPNGGVKEQVAGLYSQRMAENGYIYLRSNYLPERIHAESLSCNPRF